MQHSVLAVRSPLDLLLHHVAPIGLAAARGTALIVDLDGSAPAYPASTSVAELVSDGPRREHLRPGRPGVAILANGGAGAEEALRLVEILAHGWPAVVVRAPDLDLPIPTVPVFPAFPADWGALRSRPAMLQSLAPHGRTRPGTLPPLRPGQVRSMLSGRVGARWRWVSAWAPAWDMAWD